MQNFSVDFVLLSRTVKSKFPPKTHKQKFSQVIIGSTVSVVSWWNFFTIYWFLLPVSSTRESNQIAGRWTWTGSREKFSLLTAGILGHACSPPSKVLISYGRRWIWLLINSVKSGSAVVISLISGYCIPLFSEIQKKNPVIRLQHFVKNWVKSSKKS